MIYFSLFFFFFAFFNAKLINHIILSRNVFFFKFFGGIKGFLILTWELEKKRRKVVVHHTPQEVAPSS
jgi:hypothetical protein